MPKLTLECTLEEKFFLAEWKLKIQEWNPRQFEELRELSLRLLEALVTQKAATRGILEQALSAPSTSYKAFLEQESATSEPG